MDELPSLSWGSSSVEWLEIAWLRDPTCGPAVRGLGEGPTASQQLNFGQEGLYSEFI